MRGQVIGMEAFSVWLNERLLPQLMAATLHVRDAALAYPEASAALGALCLVSSWAAGSAAIFLAALGLGMVTLSSMQLAQGELSAILGACGVLASLALCVWCLAVRRRTLHFRRRLNAANEKLATTQGLLDREIEWRMAGVQRADLHPVAKDGEQAVP